MARSIITIGQTKKMCPLTRTSRAYRYSDIKAKDGWVSIDICLPIPYDLMHLRLAKAIRPKSGWWTGKEWQGLHVRKEDKITAWRRNHDFD